MEKNEKKPTIMNAFQLISLSNVLNLSGLFDTPEVKLIRLVSLLSLKATKNCRIWVFKDFVLFVSQILLNLIIYAPR
jgi:hypothetical protein